MHCIFCKDSSDESVSVEHIIPESLGNTEHILPAGVVCDRCNNYFSRKIEGPLLNDPWFVQHRHENFIANKRRRHPVLPGLMFPTGISVGLQRHRDGSTNLGAIKPNEEGQWVRDLLQRDRGSLLIPVARPPEGRLMARFLCKAGLETMASRVLDVRDGLREITDHEQLDELRRFVRIGDAPDEWPFHARRLYDPERAFPDPDKETQILHEFMLHDTPWQEMFFVLALFGYEFAINMGGPDIAGYERWIRENDGASPLWPHGLPDQPPLR